MKYFFAVLALVLLAAYSATYALMCRFSPVDTCGVYGWVTTYFAQARVPMFTGFLTLGSFLLTLQTAIIQRLREAYDTNDYADRVLILRGRGKPVRYYASLERMSTALSTNVVLALLTSATQMTVGFVQTLWSTSICIAMGLTSVALVVYLTVELSLAHKEWFKKIEADKEAVLKKRQDAAAQPPSIG